MMSNNIDFNVLTTDTATDSIKRSMRELNKKTIFIKYYQRIDTISIRGMNDETFNFTSSTLRQVGIRKDELQKMTIEWLDGEPYWVEVL